MPPKQASGRGATKEAQAQQRKQHLTEAQLDAIASKLAFDEVSDVFGSLVLDRTQSSMQDTSHVLLRFLWDSAEMGLQEAFDFFGGVAIHIISAEGDAAMGLLQVFSYLQEHPNSVVALRELKAVICFWTGCQLSGNTMLMHDLEVQNRIVELFAIGFLQSSTAFDLFASNVSNRFEVYDAMARFAGNVLGREPQNIAALLVKSRLQSDDRLKLRMKLEALESMNDTEETKWMNWRPRLLELIGLCFGGMGDFESAAKYYSLALGSNPQHSSMYLQAQCLNSLRRNKEALEILEKYICRVADCACHDDFWFPNALYLKGLIIVHLSLPSIQAAGSRNAYENSGEFRDAVECYKQAKAAESLRCPFFGEVDTAAKRSLNRICSFVGGDAEEQHLALQRLKVAYENRDPVATNANRTVKLADLDEDDLPSVANSHAVSSDSSEVRVHILRFSRHPQELNDELLYGEHLAACNSALRSHGFDPLQHSGAKVFTDPADFDVVVRALQNQDLKPYNVVVACQFLDAVDHAVASLRSKLQVRPKGDEQICISKCRYCEAPQPTKLCSRCKSARYCSQMCQKADYKNHSKICRQPFDDGLPCIVSRTFLEVRIPGFTEGCRSKVTKSTTDADPKKGSNPRR